MITRHDKVNFITLVWTAIISGLALLSLVYITAIIAG